MSSFSAPSIDRHLYIFTPQGYITYKILQFTEFSFASACRHPTSNTSAMFNSYINVGAFMPFMLIQDASA